MEKTIKESSTFIEKENLGLSQSDYVRDDVGQEYDPTNVVGYMEETYPEMTSEFKTIQRERYELFCRKQSDYGRRNFDVGRILRPREDS